MNMPPGNGMVGMGGAGGGMQVSPVPGGGSSAGPGNSMSGGMPMNNMAGVNMGGNRMMGDQWSGQRFPAPIGQGQQVMGQQPQQQQMNMRQMAPNNMMGNQQQQAQQPMAGMMGPGVNVNANMPSNPGQQQHNAAAAAAAALRAAGGTAVAGAPGTGAAAAGGPQRPLPQALNELLQTLKSPSTPQQQQSIPQESAARPDAGPTSEAGLNGEHHPTTESHGSRWSNAKRATAASSNSADTKQPGAGQAGIRGQK